MKSGEYPSPADASKFFEWRPLSIRTKITAMRIWMKQEEVDNVEAELISKLFDKTQKASLWQLFKMKRTSTSNRAAASAYDEIGTASKGKRNGGVQVIKNKAMQIALFDSDEEAWEDHTVTILQVYKEAFKQSANDEWLYMGALEMRMGKRSARRFARLNYLPTREDKHGETQYKYSVDSENRSRSLTKEGRIEKSKTVDAEEHGQLSTMMNEFFSSGQTFGGGHMKKRPSGSSTLQSPFADFGFPEEPSSSGNAGDSKHDDDEDDEEEEEEEEEEDAAPTPLEICKAYVTKITKSVTRLLQLAEALKGKSRATAIVAAAREERSKQEALIKTVQKTITAKKPEDKNIKALNRDVEKSLLAAQKLMKEAKPHIIGSKESKQTKALENSSSA